MDSFIDVFMVSPTVLVVLFFVAILAGFIDSLAGGGGLLTVPALMAAGLPPAQALATNKLQACGGSLSASLYFIRRKVVNLADQKLNILMTFLGSTGGALLVQHVQSDVLKQILPILVIGIGLYFLLMPKLGEEDRQSVWPAVCPDRRRLRWLLRRFLWPGRRIFLRAGVRHAGRVQPGEIDRTCEIAERDV